MNDADKVRLRDRSKPRVVVQGACATKRRYASEEAARAVGLYALEMGNAERLWVYHCDGCRGWHLTKSSKSARFAVHVEGT